MNILKAISFIILLCWNACTLFAQNTMPTDTTDKELKAGSVINGSTKPDERIKVDEQKTNLQRTEQGGNPRYEVERVYNPETNLNEGSIGEYVTVKVKFLPDLIAEQTAKGKRIIPFINGLPIKGVTGVIIKDTNSVDSEIRFLLKVKGSEDSWMELLRKPKLELDSKNLVTFSLGLEGEREIKANSKNFSLLVSTSKISLQFIAVAIVLLILMFYLGKNTAMLREPTDSNTNVKKRPYSLALTQMAFWTYLVIATYLALFLITKEFPAITGSVLVLIGISSATALGSVMINYNTLNERRNNEIALNAEKEMLEKRITEIDSYMVEKKSKTNTLELQLERDEKQKRLNEIVKTAAREKPPIQVSCKGFIKDLLNDYTGISLYRFQIAIWTLLMGYIFVYNVWTNLSMPQFDDTLLALMGISSGTYLGFKIPEQKQAV